MAENLRLNRSRVTVATIAAAITLAGCAGGDNTLVNAGTSETSDTLVFDSESVLPDAAALGACPPHLEEVFADGRADYEPIHGRMLRRSVTWYAIDTIRADRAARSTTTIPQDRSIPVELVDASPLGTNDDRGGEPRTLDARLYGPSRSHVHMAVGAGYTLHVAVNEKTGTIDLMLAADRHGRIAFVGECEARMATLGVSGYLDETAPEARTPRAAVLAIVADPNGEAAASFRQWAGVEAIAWIDLPPDGRAFDPDAMPQDVLDQLGGATLEFDIPAPWRDRTDVTLCTKTPLFWGDCTLLNVDPPDGPVHLIARVRPGDPLEVWLMDEQASFDNPLALLYTVDEGTARTLIDTREPLRLAPADGIRSLDQLLDHARAGETVLVATN